MRLLNFLLYKLLFAGTMFFAAGAVADVGAGGGDAGAGADAGAGDSGAINVDDGGEAGDSDLGGIVSEGDGPDSGRVADPDQNVAPERSTPGLDPKWQKAFKLAKEAGVEKEVKQLYFAQQRLAKVIPGGVNAAIELAKSVEEFGGVDGIQQLQSDLETHQQDGELFERADPRWVESGFQENPESALKLFAHSLDYVAEHHGEQYDHLMAKVIVNDLHSDSGLPVRDIHGILAALKDNPQAQELARKLAAYYNARTNLARQVPEKKVDAQQKALTDKQTALDKKEMDLRYSEVNSQVMPTMKSQISSALATVAKESGVDLKQIAKDYPGAWEDMVAKIHKRMTLSALKDQRFIGKHYALVKKGDLKRAADAVNAKHDAIVKDVVREVATKSGLFKGKKAAPAPGDKNNAGDKGNNANAGWLRVSGPPDKGTVDWSKTTIGMKLDDKAVLLDGKKVTWA